jgi:hypothetical protein
MKETILQEALRLTTGDRNKDYGHPLDDFGKVTGMALALWGRGPQTPEEHAIYMVLVKIAREVNRPKRDNRVDGAGYFGTLDMIHEERARRDDLEHATATFAPLTPFDEAPPSTGAVTDPSL